MALPLGKLTLIVGAGLVGSVLAKEGRLPGAYDLFSGAYRIFVKPLKQENSTKLTSKPKYDIMQEVDMLREEISLLTPNRAITIVTGSQSGSGKYGVIVIVVVFGSGYVWWKGWRLPDMMFATRRSLSDARTTIAKQLENVYSSISDTKRFLSSRLQRVDSKIDESVEITAATRCEVSAAQGDVKQIGEKVKRVRSSILHLESRFNNIDGKQNVTCMGVDSLVRVAMDIQNGKLMKPIEGFASRPALEMPNESPSRSLSMPVNTSVEPPSPTTNGFLQKQASFSSASSSQSSVPRWKQFSGTSDGLGIASVSTPQVSNVTRASEDANSGSLQRGNSFTSVFGRTISSLSFLPRGFSTDKSTKQ